MDWGVKPISRGEWPESYTIQLPLFMSEFGKFPELEGGPESVRFEIGGRAATIERKYHYYVVRVRGFKECGAAEGFLRRMAAGLFLLTIRQRSGLQFDPDPMPIEVEHNRPIRDMFPPEMYGDWERREDGTYTDGGLWPMWTAIFAEHERIIEHKMMWARKADHLKTKYIADSFKLANENFDADRIAGDQKLRLVLRLYASAQRQADARVGFVNLVTALEVLGGERRLVPASALAVISELSELVKRERDGHSRASPDGAAAHGELDRLLSRMADLKKQSITASVRDYVYEKLYAGAGLVSGVEEISREVSDARVKDIYGVRSSLVHAGVVSADNGKTADERFSESNNHLHQLMPRLLLVELAAHAAPGKLPIPEWLAIRDHG